MKKMKITGLFTLIIGLSMSVLANPGNVNGFEKQTESIEKTNSVLVLAPPVATAATDITSTSFKANWESSGSSVTYLVRVVDGETQDFFLLDIETSNTYYNVTGLKPKHAYAFSVKSKLGKSESAISNWIDVTTLPPAPVANTATNITSTSFTANWSDVDGATSFLLRVTDNSTQEFIIKDLALQALSFEVNQLKPNNSYSYSVIARFDNNQESGLSNWVDVTTLPMAPVATAATNITSTSFTANWGDVDGATSFLLRVTDDATQEFIIKDLALQALSFEVNQLKPNNSYSYAVIARFDNNQESELSNWIQLTTKNTTKVNNSNCLKLNIYPNPASDYISVKGVEKGAEIKLVNLSGRLVQQLVTQTSNERISLKGIKQGVYFVVVENGGTQLSGKVMVE
jgi:hypothetical protein